MRPGICVRCDFLELIIMRSGDRHAELIGERGLRCRRAHHLTILLGASFIVCAAFVLRLHSEGSLRLPGSDRRLPTLCASRVTLGLDCPGCGLTRSFVALAGGDMRQAYAFNRVGWLIAAAVVLQIPYRSYAVCRPTSVMRQAWTLATIYAIVAVLVVNWLLKIAGV